MKETLDSAIARRELGSVPTDEMTHLGALDGAGEPYVLIRIAETYAACSLADARRIFDEWGSDIQHALGAVKGSRAERARLLTAASPLLLTEVAGDGVRVFIGRDMEASFFDAAEVEDEATNALLRETYARRLAKRKRDKTLMTWVPLEHFQKIHRSLGLAVYQAEILAREHADVREYVAAAGEGQR